MPIDPLIKDWTARAESALERALATQSDAPGLEAAMRYAVLGGGKRLRPLLAYAAGHAFGGALAQLDAGAVSVELIHAFSLVHDDLPAMDDDDLRRGRPTVHVAFDVATAILAGDALHALAFTVLAEAPLQSEVRIALVAELARASGAAGMCAGQALDMAATGQVLDLGRLETLHSLKTGALIRAAVRMGAISVGASPEEIRPLEVYANALGLAFQIRDDILDIEGNSVQLGKTAGKDLAQGKSTYPGLLGMERSRQRLQELSLEMTTALGPLGHAADGLRTLAEFAVARAN